MSRGGCSRPESTGIEAADPALSYFPAMPIPHFARDRQLRFQLDSGREHRGKKQ
eukprot:gene9861-biopygen2895